MEKSLWKTVGQFLTKLNLYIHSHLEVSIPRNLAKLSHFCTKAYMSMIISTLLVFIRDEKQLKSPSSGILINCGILINGVQQICGLSIQQNIRNIVYLYNVIQ